MVDKIKWKDLDELDVTSALVFFPDILHAGMIKHIPESKPSKKSDKQRQKPLWTSGNMLRKVKRNIMPGNATRLPNSMVAMVKVILRNTATHGVRSAKIEFERKLADEIKKNPKSFWSYVRLKTKVKKV